MPGKHTERPFEDEIVSILTEKSGWILGQSEHYDRDRALYPEDLIGYIKETQEDEWQKSVERHGSAAEEQLLDFITKELERKGTLQVLRDPLNDINATFQVCQFKPAHFDNPETLIPYEKNRLRLVRQLYYSKENQKSIDLVLFLNGIPVATVELKTGFTQGVEKAVRQYKVDRLPVNPETRGREPLLTFKRGALVHFAAGSEEIFMTTHLMGDLTYFLPFNQGDGFHKGNPENPDGYRTNYFWKETLQRENFLDILGRFLFLEKKEEDNPGKKSKTVIERMIFPRYHQWRSVQKIVTDSQEKGPGDRYLIQHSAGSGKSNTIAWTAYRLSSLYLEHAANKKVFDSVIVITDRRVLDKQLQDTIYQIEHKAGMVAFISDENRGEGTKSDQLRNALIGKTSVVVVTIQTFPFALQLLSDDPVLSKGKYAVIADEAHSSQSGNAALQVRKMLTSELEEFGPDEEEISSEDFLRAAIKARKIPANISYYAFTATPKGKTLELFGRPGADGKPEPFDVYTMQQAIEEGFILDVIKNYTTYGTAFKLQRKNEAVDTEVDSKKAKKRIFRWVHEHPDTIQKKSEIILEHFISRVKHRLGGRAKAMVVASSRLEAARYKTALDKYAKDRGWEDLGVLVAFSGELNDTEIPDRKLTETNMNQELKGMDIAEAFKLDSYRVLVVANKFQTGFDQPLLCVMYVDKKISGINAVQTLSRLNRSRPGKSDADIFILDFENTEDEILQAFLPYYKDAKLSSQTDPNKIYQLKEKLDGSQLYTKQEVLDYVDAFYNEKKKQSAMNQALQGAVNRWKKLPEAEQDLFKKDLGTYVRLYDFLSQIVCYENIDLESLREFGKGLLPFLRNDWKDDPVDLSNVDMKQLRVYKIKENQLDMVAAEKSGNYQTEIDPFDEAGQGIAKPGSREYISTIIEQINELILSHLPGEIDTVAGRNFVQQTAERLMDDPDIQENAIYNNLDQFKIGKFQDRLFPAIQKNMDSNEKIAELLINQEELQKQVGGLLAEMVYYLIRDKRKASGEN